MLGPFWKEREYYTDKHKDLSTKERETRGLGDGGVGGGGEEADGVREKKDQTDSTGLL